MVMTGEWFILVLTSRGTMETPELLRTAPSHQSPPRSKAKGVGVLHAAGAAAPSS